VGLSGLAVALPMHPVHAHTYTFLKMHPENWMDQLLGTKAKVRILRVLATDPALLRTEADVARAAGLPPTTVNLALRSLRDAGILDFQRLGRTHGVRLRGDLAIVAALRAMFALEHDIRSEVEAAIRGAVPAGVACVLFGSTAKGGAGPGSDLDLLVVARSRDGAEDAAGAVRAAIARVMPARVEIVALSGAEFAKRRRSSLLRSALAGGKPLSDTPLGAFP
jgi:predicted nucleotidyltransferase